MSDRKVRAATWVATYWRDSYLRQGVTPENVLGTHALAMVVAALLGEIDPRQLGIEPHRDEDFRAALGPPDFDRPPLYTEGEVKAMADVIHEDCLLEWNAIGITDPSRMVTQHMSDAHYAQAHDYCRRLAEKAREPQNRPVPMPAIRDTVPRKERPLG